MNRALQIHNVETSLSSKFIEYAWKYTFPDRDRK